jgi:hypothetical protein
MKTNILKTAVIAGALLIASPAFAATAVNLSPSSVSTAAGKTFTVTVAVDPQGASDYAEKIELNYPADLLSVQSFSLAANWMALSQSGYDVVDNTNGDLIKSAGLPSGLTGNTVFGTVTFLVKKSGSGSISVGSGSVAFGANSQSASAGSPVTVSAGSSAPAAAPVSAPAPAKSTAPAVTATKADTSVAPASATSTDDASVMAANESASTSDQVAAVAASGFNYNWLWLVLAVVILGAIYYFVRKGKKA